MAHDDLDDLLPVLRVADELDEASPTRDGDEKLVLRPFVGQLLISYVVEKGDLGRPFSERDLRVSGIDELRLHERALDNLARHVRSVGIRLRAYGSIMAVLFDGDLEATLMLYPTLWDHLREEMGDELVVGVPARDVLAVSPLESAEG